jgi:predicted component of type VI protein secretion system
MTKTLKSQSRLVALVALLLIVPACLSAGDKKKNKPEEQFCTLSFVVLRDSNGKPVKNASVVIHSLRKDGSQQADGFQLKSDTDGKALINDIPYGKLRLQVLAPHFQTYGDDIEIKEPAQEFVIRLKPPAEQVSIY